MKYITCNYQGRLGNLMFEIAAVVSAAKDNNMTPTFPEKYHRYYNDISAFKQYLLPILSQFHSHKKDMVFNDYPENSDMSYSPIVVSENTKLIGYFTSSLYFKNNRRGVIAMFSTHQDEVADICHNIRQKFPGRQLVSVHVRRTDYVTDYNWALTIDYYQKAATFFDNPVFVIFSDDHGWCHHHFSFMEEKIFVNEKDFIELLLMGKMDAHICANSTFSAMGVILGDADQTKKVIAPEKWCPTLFNHNVYEPHWIKI